MVQKYQSPVRVYKYPFEIVMAVSVQYYKRSKFLSELYEPIQLQITAVSLKHDGPTGRTTGQA